MQLSLFLSLSDSRAFSHPPPSHADIAPSLSHPSPQPQDLAKEDTLPHELCESLLEYLHRKGQVRRTPSSSLSDTHSHTHTHTHTRPQPNTHQHTHSPPSRTHKHTHSPAPLATAPLHSRPRPQPCLNCTSTAAPRRRISCRACRSRKSGSGCARPLKTSTSARCAATQRHPRPTTRQTQQTRRPRSTAAAAAQGPAASATGAAAKRPTPPPPRRTARRRTSPRCAARPTPAPSRCPTVARSPATMTAWTRQRTPRWRRAPTARTCP